MSEDLAMFIFRSTQGLDLSRGKLAVLRRARRRMDLAVPGWRGLALGDEADVELLVVLAQRGDAPDVELVMAANPEATG